MEIGGGCVIGAGSVVTRSVPPFSMAYGVPAVVRRGPPPPASGSPA